MGDESIVLGVLIGGVAGLLVSVIGIEVLEYFERRNKRLKGK